MLSSVDSSLNSVNAWWPKPGDIKATYPAEKSDRTVTPQPITENVLSLFDQFTDSVANIEEIDEENKQNLLNLFSMARQQLEKTLTQKNTWA